MSALPEPPVPPECDVRSMPSMMLDLTRLFNSELYLDSTGDQFKAAVTLWGKAFHQVPAGSLPNNERILAILSGAGHAKWRRVRDVALRGWTLCSDGRLYHPVVAEKAMEAWAIRRDQSGRAKRGWERRKTTVPPVSTDRIENADNATLSDKSLSSRGSDHAGALPGRGAGVAPAMQQNQTEEREELRSSRAAAPTGPAEKGVDLFPDAPPDAGGRSRPKRRGAPGARPDAALRSEAVATLMALAGLPAAEAWPLFQGWVKAAGGDAAAVCGFIAEAEASGAPNPKGFVFRCIQNRAVRAAEADEPLPREANGWIVGEIVDECDRIAKAHIAGFWPDFPRLIARALDDKADPYEHIYPVVRSVAGRVETEVQSVGYFAAGIRNAMRERKAAA